MLWERNFTSRRLRLSGSLRDLKSAFVCFEAVPNATVGILQHWFSGDVENEPIEISAVESVTIETKPQRFENDVLYMLHAAEEWREQK